jgi:dihydroxyacetone kinase-like protein
MQTGMTTASIQWALGRLTEKLPASFDELNELDAVVGDGDLGITIARAADGLSAETAKLPDDVGLALLRCAQTVIRTAAGTFGTLWATGLMAAGHETRGLTVVPWTELSRLLDLAGAAIARRSQGQLGDKTVLDAIDAVCHATCGLDSPQALAHAAVRAVSSAIERFRPLPFRQGRARIFGNAAAGRDDPGMIAFLRMVESLAPEETGEQVSTRAVREATR